MGTSCSSNVTRSIFDTCCLDAAREREGAATDVASPSTSPTAPLPRAAPPPVGCQRTPMLRFPLFGNSDPRWGPRCSPALADPRCYAGYYFGCQRAPNATRGIISAARVLQMLRFPLVGSSDPCWGPRCSPALAGPGCCAGYYFGCQKAPNATISTSRKL